MSRTLLAGILTGTLLIGVGIARGQCEPHWRAAPPAMPLLDGVAYATTIFDDGTGPALYVGGDFVIPANPPIQNLVRWNGIGWEAVGGQLDGVVRALVVQDGLLLVGGTFTHAGDLQVHRVARWDGSSWGPLGDGMDDEVDTLVEHGGSLIAGGWFTHADGTPVNRVARWDGNQWQAIGGGMNQAVSALATYGEDLIAAGRFTSAGGESANRIARWDGSAWHPLAGGLDQAARALTVYNGELIAGGDFLYADDVPVAKIAAWSGSTWHALGGMTSSIYDYVSALGVFDDFLVAGGVFTVAGEVEANSIARWDGTQWSALGGGLYGVQDLTLLNDQIVAVGFFHFLYGGDAVARFDGATWQAFGGNGLDGIVTGLLEYDGELVATGGFFRADGQNTSQIARWNGDRWRALGEGLSGGPGNVLATMPLMPFGGELIVGGIFTSAGGMPAAAIAAWTGDTWHEFGGGVGGVSTPYVGALAVYHGDLIAGGHFHTAGGTEVRNIARWDGSVWQPLGDGVNNEIYAMTIYHEELIVGGVFGTAGGQTANCIASWDGSDWHTLGSGMSDGINAPAMVLALTTYNGDLIAGGNFRIAGGTSVNHIARWDGAQWRDFDAGFDFYVEAVSTYHGDLIAAGDFSVASWYNVGGIVRWDAVSGAWQALGDGLAGQYPGWHGTGFALGTYGADLVVGGLFYYAGGQLSPYWARWVSASLSIVEPPASQEACPGDTAVFHTSAVGDEPITFHWRKDGVDLADGGNISGATTDTLTIASVGTEDVGSYDVVATNVCDPVISDPATLTLRTVAITLQPQPQFVLTGDNAFLSAAGEPAPVTYQWRRNGVALADDWHIQGATEPNLSIWYAVGSDMGDYTVDVTNDCGTITSDPALLTVWAFADLNCDGIVDFDDIDPFVLALSDQATWQATYPSCYYFNADCNADGVVNFDDIDWFVMFLGGK